MTYEMWAMAAVVAGIVAYLVMKKIQEDRS